MMMLLNSVRVSNGVKNTQKEFNFGLVGFQGLPAAGGTVSDRKGDLKARNRNWGVNSKKQWLETTD